MATENKTDRKKQFRTEVFASILVFQTVDPEAEIARLDVDSMDDATARALCIYGAKQICSDVVANLGTMAEKVAGVQRAVASLNSGVWPTRQTTISVDAAAAKLAQAMGMSLADMMAKLKG